MRDRAAYRGFLRQAWHQYVESRATSRVREETPAWKTLFEDRRLQDGLGVIVRGGHLEPVGVGDPDAFPTWAQSGLTHDTLRQPLAEPALALGNIETLLERDDTWDTWCEIAWLWAQATLVMYAGIALPEDAQRRYADAGDVLAPRFVAWLMAQYASLAGQRLPEPHHLCHVPHFIAHQRRAAPSTGWVALLVMDGMSLADWLLIRAAWQRGHPGWRLHERLLLAQIPTITSVSRQALVSGRFPVDLDDLRTNTQEESLWQSFWAEHALDSDRVAYGRLALHRSESPDAVYSPRIAALCLIDHSIDQLSHGASLGAAQVQASLTRWLADYAPALEALMEDLLDRGYAVYLTSDHGHVEATGMGRPNEGILAETRGQRVRIYGDPAQARSAHAAFPETILWEHNALLPDNLHVLMPNRRQAFTTYGERIVTHGGVTLDEVMVPFVSIAKEEPCP